MANPDIKKHAYLPPIISSGALNKSFVIVCIGAFLPPEIRLVHELEQEAGVSP
jgi:hypothetical protein